MFKRMLSTTAVVAIPLFFGLTSCASLFSDYCKKRNDCLGGNDADRAACADSLRGEENVAAEYKCSDQFDAYYECRNNTAVCNAGRFESSCDPQKKNYDDCIKNASTIR